MEGDAHHAIGEHWEAVLVRQHMPPKSHHAHLTYEGFVRKIGENIRAARAARSLTAEQLAAKADVVVSTITHYEAGDVKGPTLETLLKIANAMDAPPSLLFETGAEGRYNDKIRQQLARLVETIEGESKK